MADSSSSRSPRGGPLPPRRDGASSDPARQAVSDPLAELARLIGQDEAFGAIMRDTARPEPQHEQNPSPSWRSRTEPASWQTRHEEPASHDPYEYAHEERPSAQAAYDPHHYDEAHAAEDVHPHQGAAQAAAHYDHDAGGEYYEEAAESHEDAEGHYE